MSFAEVAALLRPGEWTTYGDIATAAGRPRSARAVGHAAASSSDFPHAHRVLTHDGRIARGPDKASVDRARRLLEGEGVMFLGSGAADPHRRVYWDELQRRAGRVPRG